MEKKKEAIWLWEFLCREGGSEGGRRRGGALWGGSVYAGELDCSLCTHWNAFALTSAEIRHSHSWFEDISPAGKVIPADAVFIHPRAVFPPRMRHRKPLCSCQDCEERSWSLSVISTARQSPPCVLLLLFGGVVLHEGGEEAAAFLLLALAEGWCWTRRRVSMMHFLFALARMCETYNTGFKDRGVCVPLCGTNLLFHAKLVFLWLLTPAAEQKTVLPKLRGIIHLILWCCPFSPCQYS